MSVTKTLQILYHPDGPGPYSDDSMFKSLMRAYEDVLCNQRCPTFKKKYDDARMTYLKENGGVSLLNTVDSSWKGGRHEQTNRYGEKCGNCHEPTLFCFEHQHQAGPGYKYECREVSINLLVIYPSSVLIPYADSNIPFFFHLDSIISLLIQCRKRASKKCPEHRPVFLFWFYSTRDKIWRPCKRCKSEGKMCPRHRYVAITNFSWWERYGTAPQQQLERAEQEDGDAQSSETVNNNDGPEYDDVFGLFSDFAYGSSA
jgi:hypothetical protein